MKLFNVIMLFNSVVSQHGKDLLLLEIQEALNPYKNISGMRSHPKKAKKQIREGRRFLNDKPGNPISFLKITQNSALTFSPPKPFWGINEYFTKNDFVQ